ncbi:metalloprotease [Roseburia faecis]|uniref:metalloprotease n=1 Tax=Roseburia faecis TaxID=301302 RepID=UPI001920A7B3|nr:M50 family metallopeptidase [Roseburia faecis]
MEQYWKTTGPIEQKVLFKKKTENIYCIGSRSSDKYIYAPDREADVIYTILHWIDQGKSIVEIQKDMGDRYGMSQKNVDVIIEKCKKAGLIKIPNGENIKPDVDEYELMMVKLKDFSLIKIYPVFHMLIKYFRIIFVLMLCVMMFAVASVAMNMDKVDFPWKEVFANPKTLLYMWVIQFFSLVLHEFAHAIVGYKYGAKPESFSVAVFYYCTLIFYIRLPGIYFKTQKERIKIWSAGVFTNLFLSACFWFLFLYSSEKIQLFFAVGVMSNLMLALNNLVPFFYSDGYYILATLLKTPNLRKKSFFKIKQLFKEGLSKDTFIYWIYLGVTVLVTGGVLGGELWIVGNQIYSSILSKTGFWNIVKDYSNLLIIMLIGIVGKIISVCRKRG